MTTHPLAVAASLLDHAEACLDHAHAAHAPGPRAWLRASALLQRQALETLLDELWRRRLPGVEHASRRAQLAVLPEIIRSPEELAGQVRSAWGALSTACHRGGGLGRVHAERLRVPLGAVRELGRHGVWK